MKLSTNKAEQQLIINTQIADIEAAIASAFARPQKRHVNRPANRYVTWTRFQHVSMGNTTKQQ